MKQQVNWRVLFSSVVRIWQPTCVYFGHGQGWSLADGNYAAWLGSMAPVTDADGIPHRNLKEPRSWPRWMKQAVDLGTCYELLSLLDATRPVLSFETMRQIYHLLR